MKIRKRTVVLVVLGGLTAGVAGYVWLLFRSAFALDEEH